MNDESFIVSIRNLPLELRNQIYFYSHPTIPLHLKNDIISYVTTIKELKRALMFDFHNNFGGETYTMLLLYALRANNHCTELSDARERVNMLIQNARNSEDSLSEFRLASHFWGSLTPFHRDRFLIKLRHGFYYSDQTRIFL